MKKEFIIKKPYFKKRVKFKFKFSGMGWLRRLLTKGALWMYFNPLLQILVILGILVGLNYLGNSFYSLLDLTQYRSRSVNKETVKMVSGLDKNLTFDLFMSKNTPIEIASVKREINEYFDQLERLNPGKIQVNVINPDDNEDAKLKASVYEIKEYQYGVAQENAVTLGNYYLGVGVTYDTKKTKILGLDGRLDASVLPSINKQIISYLEREMLEYMRGLKDQPKSKIGLVVLGKNKESGSLASQFANLSKNVVFTDVDLDTQNDLAQFVGLWIISPNVNLSEKALLQLDQYVLRGGRVVFLAEGYQVDSQSLSPATLANSNVMDLLLSYGLEFSKGMVMDPNYATQYAYPYIFNVTSNNFAKNEILNGLQSLRLSWVTSYKENLQNYTDGKKPKVTSLFRTSEKAGLFEGETVPLSLDQKFTFPNRGTQHLAFLVEGYLKSHFIGVKEAKRKALLKEYQKLAGANAKLQDNGANSKIVVIGASLFGGIDVNLLPPLVYWSVNDSTMLRAFKSNGKTIVFQSGLTNQEVKRYKRLSYLVPFFGLILLGSSAYLFNRQK